MRITLISAFLLVACNGGEQGTTGTPVTAAGTASTATTLTTDSGASTDSGTPPTGPELRVEGAWFVDAGDGAVFLRGLNVAGNSKVPPFVPLTDPAVLDPLAVSGVNVIRLVFNWEAYEPQRGVYDDAYLAAMVDIAQWSWDREIYVVVDFHQDGFSRYLAGGCGDGFPEWAHPAGTTLDPPDNGPACVNWGVQMTLDPRVHSSFGAFYADDEGVRTAWLEMWGRVAAAFQPTPGVIGYDLLNEPWGFEASELAPLYEDAAVAIRSVHPDAILFVEGHVTTNGGAIQTGLPRPMFDNFAYSPHFYDALVLVTHTYLGLTTATDIGFDTMATKATEWNVPLFIGEFGTHGDTFGAADYMDLQYARMDERLASGAQWNFTPGWDAVDKDGWNDEDLSITDDVGAIRPNWRVRPYPRRVAGIPSSFSAVGDEVILTWQHIEGSGETRIFVPSEALWGVAAPAMLSSDPNLACAYDMPSKSVICSGPATGDVTVMVTPT